MWINDKEVPRFLMWFIWVELDGPIDLNWTVQRAKTGLSKEIKPSNSTNDRPLWFKRSSTMILAHMTVQFGSRPLIFRWTLDSKERPLSGHPIKTWKLIRLVHSRVHRSLVVGYYFGICCCDYFFYNQFHHCDKYTLVAEALSDRLGWSIWIALDCLPKFQKF